MKNIIIRQEIFGATVFNCTSGEKYYINNDEYSSFKRFNKLPKELGIERFKIKKSIELLGNERDDKFSFADIAYIELTRSCNLKCKHCLNNSGEKLKNQLNYKELIRIVDDFSKAGIFEIRFTGGEPLLFPKIYELINYATEKGIYVSIGTNGTLINESVSKKLKKAGLKKCVISLDGTREAHDLIRGKGCYEKVIKAIKYLKKERITIKINSVIMKSNMQDVINLAKEMYRTKTPMFIRRFIESGRGANLNNNTLSKADYDYVKYQLRTKLLDGTTVRGHYINLTDQAEKSRIKIPFKITLSCKVGQRSLIITPEGNINYCGFLAAQGFPPIGNVREISDIRKFWNNDNYSIKLDKLNRSLNDYNSINGVQKTNCLAYAQNLINKNKELIIFVSKDNLYRGQVSKIINDSYYKVKIIQIEEFYKNKIILTLDNNQVVYFICCNSPLIAKAIGLIKGGKIINKDYLMNDYKKISIQKVLSKSDISVPKIYNKNDFNYPIFCKENIHQGIIFKAYNSRTISKYFEHFNIDKYYFEESIESKIEYKLYFVSNKIYFKDGKLYKNKEELRDLCIKVSKVLNNLEVFSIDIISYKGTYYIIDVNSSAGFYQSDDARKEFLYYVGEL